MERRKTADKTQSAHNHESLAVALALRKVDIDPGSVAYYQSIPEGFMHNGWFYEVNEELFYLGRNYEMALEVAQTGKRTLRGIVGMGRDKKTSQSSSIQNGQMTRGQKIGQACAILFTGATLGTTIGALEEAGYGKSAFGAKAGIGLLGILAQGSKSPAIRTTGLLALGGITYDVAKNNIAPIAAVALPTSSSDQDTQPLQTLDEARDKRRELELVVSKQEQEVTSRPSVLGADSSSDAKTSQAPTIVKETEKVMSHAHSATS